MSIKTPLRRSFLLTLGVALCVPSAQAVSVEDYASIQEAIDANPGRMIHVPSGDYVISEKLRIGSDDCGLYGRGTIIQTRPDHLILEVEHAERVRVEGLTFTRAKGVQVATQSGVFLYDSVDVELSGIRVLDNHARGGAVEIRDCTRCTVRDCFVRNYKRLAVDDRTNSPLYGYAFHAIDGHGLLVRDSVGTVIRNNRIVEDRLLPTREMKEEHGLGNRTEGKFPSKEGKLGGQMFRDGYVNNWHQGSAIMVSGPEKTSHTTLTGNFIENCAQGIDLHCDNVVCSGNTIDRGMIGIKMTHGSRNLIVTGNLISRVDLWGILLNPGSLSHFPEEASGERRARGANVDAGTIVANNIVTDYGYGNDYWNWGGAREGAPGAYAIALYEGQLETNPPLTDILIQGNMVYNTGKDKKMVDGKPVEQPPRYRWAVYVGPWGETGKRGPTYPMDIRFSDNLFHPGLAGVSNIEIEP